MIAYFKMCDHVIDMIACFQGDFVAGACLGAFISTVSFPINTTKTHMQVAEQHCRLWNIFNLLKNNGALKITQNGCMDVVFMFAMKYFFTKMQKNFVKI